MLYWLRVLYLNDREAAYCKDSSRREMQGSPHGKVSHTVPAPKEAYAVRLLCCQGKLPEFPPRA